MSPADALGARLESDVLAAREGDAPAFGRLVDETKGAVTAIALAIVGDYPTSQDIAQDVFLSAWRNLARLRSPSSFLPWLRQTTRNRARTWLRDQGRRRLAATQVDELLPGVAAAGPDPSELLVEREERRLVGEALADLSDDAREAVILYYREGQSVAQVAYLLDLTQATVRQRLSRSRRRMRKAVAERLDRALSRTAPGAAFTAAVLTGLSVAAPPAASAAMGTAAKVAGTSFIVKLATALGGIVVGASGGILGFLLGLRWEFRQADARERRQLRRFAAAGVGLVLGTSVGFNLSGPSNTWIAPTSIYLVFGLGLWLMLFVWLPRITGPRLAAERAADPEAEARLRRRERIKRVGFVGGFLAGGAGLLAGLFKSGLLP
ncbi:MAG: RNA polymerase sigma factor [Acidobacteria bacterium]|nr:RNA polymerase sigma factor [Acidobacteriota bacterium]